MKRLLEKLSDSSRLDVNVLEQHLEALQSGLYIYTNC